MLFGLTTVILLAAISWLYLFSIYEVRFEVENLDGAVTVSCIPVNSLGKRVPFRNLKCSYYFTTGEERISQIARSESTISFKLSADTGSAIKLKAITDLNVFPSVIEIQ